VGDAEPILPTFFSPNPSNASGSMRCCDFDNPDALFAFEECGGEDPYCSLSSPSALRFTMVDEPGVETKEATKGCIAVLKPLGMTGVIGEGTGRIGMGTGGVLFDIGVVHMSSSSRLRSQNST